MRENPVATIKPAVRPPRERVQRFVRVLISPAIEKDLRRARWLRFIAILDRNEHQVRGCADPDAAKSNLESAHEVEAFHENGALVEFAVAVGILEHQDSVLALAFGSANRVSVGLSYPKPAAIINRESNRLFNIRFAGEQRRFETGRNCHLF